MQLKVTDMQKIFRKLKMRVKESHHRNAYFYYEGKQVLKTRVSHGRGDIPKPVIEQIINQFYLRKDQFINLRKCPLTYEDYVTILKGKKIIN